jgi:predicted deacetylase
MKLLVSLHDVTPFHLPRLRRAEALCRSIGIRKLAYLFIPHYHGRYPSDEYPDFIAWCREPRTFEVEWHLHGFHHLEPASVSRGPGRSWSDAVKRRLLTDGEGEFLALDLLAQRSRLTAGRAVFRRCLGREPKTFVAPAWLFNAALPPLLRELGFRYTEDHGRVFALQTGESLRSPVITWATRTAVRKAGSLLASPLLTRLWQEEPVLRVAIHPFDLDSPRTTASIQGVLGRLLAHREQAFCRDLGFADTLGDAAD